MCNQTIAVEAIESDTSGMVDRWGDYIYRPDWYMSEMECSRMRDDIEDMLDIDGDLYTDLECDTIFTHLQEI